VVLSIVLMVIDHRYHHLQSLRSTLAVITYPLQFLADLPITTRDWLAETFATRNRLNEENRQLHADNLKLRARLQKFESLQAENLRLRDLLESSIKVGDRVLIAELSAVDLDPYRQQIVIDKGGASGVFQGQPVLDANAVMGQVVHVNPFSSTVLLITDASHALPVQVLRNGLRTIAIGSGRIDRLELPYLTNNADIREGDLLVTSGLGGKFPPGYPVAEVTQVRIAPDQPFAEVSAAPRAHLDRSREVLLVWTGSPVDGVSSSSSGLDAPAPDSAQSPAPVGDAP
jgi:rod shape-determining protein MreC